MLVVAYWVSSKTLRAPDFGDDFQISIVMWCTGAQKDVLHCENLSHLVWKHLESLEELCDQIILFPRKLAGR